jgi:Protein of unknown function (DUF2934)
MATRSRRPTGKSTSISSSSLQESEPDKNREAADQSAVTMNQNTDQSEPVPEVRLLGSLHPLPSREERIAISAYWRAAKRQFEPGHELDDWLEAEREIGSDNPNDAAQNPSER